MCSGEPSWPLTPSRFITASSVLSFSALFNNTFLKSPPLEIRILRFGGTNKKGAPHTDVNSRFHSESVRWARISYISIVVVSLLFTTFLRGVNCAHPGFSYLTSAHFWPTPFPTRTAVTSMWTRRRKSPIVRRMLETWPFFVREGGKAGDSNWNWMQGCGRQWEQPGSKLYCKSAVVFTRWTENVSCNLSQM